MKSYMGYNVVESKVYDMELHVLRCLKYTFGTGRYSQEAEVKSLPSYIV